MRIALDITSATRPNRTGMGRYSLELARSLAPLLAERGDRLVLTTKPFRSPDDAALKRLLAQNPGLVRRTAPFGCDIFHTTGITSRLGIAGVRVVTVPDTGTLDAPDLAAEDWVVKRNRKLRRTIDRAALLIVFSEFVRGRIRRHFPRFPADRIVSTPPGCDHADLLRGADADQDAVLERYSLRRGQYVLSVGRLEPRKNPETLVAAFSGCQAAGAMNLVFAGPVGGVDVSATAAKLGLGGRVRTLGRVEDSELAALYRGAAAFALVSRYEGFGLPLLEAMACGVPSLASSGTALAEIGGEATLEADPCSVRAVAAQLERLLKDEDLRRRLQATGRKRASLFTWRRCAEATVKAYQQAGGRR